MTDEEPSAPLGYRLGGSWETTAFVGRGPVGEVYECKRNETEGTFIAKLLPEELLESSETWSSYLAAVSAAGSLTSEATVRHVAFGSDLQLGCPFIVTERVSWPSLSSSVETRGPVAAKAWGKTLAVLVALLSRAHAAQIPHGRLTPTNVFVSPDDPGKVKVTDFGLGIACAARAGEALGGGVLGWAGPECEEPNAKPSTAGDVYSLGLLTFFALTGKRPFRALEAEQVHPKLLRGEMTTALKSAAEVAKKLGVELDPAFDKWFARAIVPSPDARYSSVKLQGEAFEHVLRRLYPEKPAPAATRPKAASPAASPPRPAQTSKPIAPAGADDDQPTLKLELDKLFAGTQRAEPTPPAKIAVAKKPAAVAPRAVPTRTFTALAPNIASPAPPAVAPAAPAAATLAPAATPAPAAIASPPVAVPAPPAAVMAAPPDDPPVSIAPTSSGPVSAPIIGMPVRAVGESARVDAAPVHAFAESTPAQFSPAAPYVAPQGPVAEAPAVSATNPLPMAPAATAANAPLVTRPKTAIAVGVGLVLFGVAVGIVIGRGAKSDPIAVPEPVRSAVAVATPEAPSPPATKPAEPKPPAPDVTPIPSVATPVSPQASASAAVSAQPTASPELPSVLPAGPASADVATSATASALAKPRVDIVVAPIPTTTTNARKPDATKPAATKPEPAKPAATSARKKPCGTFINPCQ